MSFNRYKIKVRSISIILAIIIYFLSSIILSTIEYPSGKTEDYISLSKDRVQRSTSLIYYDKGYNYQLKQHPSYAGNITNQYQVTVDIVYFKTMWIEKDYVEIGHDSFTIPVVSEQITVELALINAHTINFDHFQLKFSLTTTGKNIDDQVDVTIFMNYPLSTFLIDNLLFMVFLFVFLFALALNLEKRWIKHYQARRLKERGVTTEPDPRDILGHPAMEKGEKIQNAKIRQDEGEEVDRIKHKVRKDMGLRK